MGFKPPKLMQVDSLDQETRNQLWDITWQIFGSGLYGNREIQLAERLHTDFFKKSLDDFREDMGAIKANIKNHFMKCAFFDLMDLVEFLVKERPEYAGAYNLVFSKERAAYRFIDIQIVPITDEVENVVFEDVLSVSDRFAGARSHIAAALAAFSKRPAGDYRNAIREAISAVESAAKVIAGNDKADLGAALKAIDKTHGMHPAFKDAVTKLYAYTNDEKGIRHALTEGDAKVDEADAHFMLVACAAFVNFLVQRYGG
jgi:TnpA family transposase